MAYTWFVYRAVPTTVNHNPFENANKKLSPNFSVYANKTFP